MTGPGVRGGGEGALHDPALPGPARLRLSPQGSWKTIAPKLSHLPEVTQLLKDADSRPAIVRTVHEAILSLLLNAPYDWGESFHFLGLCLFICAMA